MGLSRLLLYLC